MRTIVGCLAACAAFSTLQVAAAETVAYIPEPLVFTTPAENDRGAMMLGDGEVGALAWVSGDGTLHAVLQRSDSWNEVGEHVKIGQIDYVSSRPVDEGTYRQELSMARGAFEATWKSGGKPVSVHYRLQWEGGNFAVCEFTGAPDAVAKSVNWRLYPGGFRKTNAYELGRVINYSSGVMPNKMGVKFRLDISADRLLADLPDGFSGWCHENYKPTVDKLLAEFDRTQATADLGKPDLLHDRVFGAITRTEKATDGKTLFLSAVTCYCPCAGESEWRRRTLDQLAKQGWQSAQEPSRRAAHVAGWRQFWDRSHIVVSPANSNISPAECRAANVAWACQRYLTRCAGTGKLAMRYNGSLFTATEKGNPDYRLWGHGYWWQNVRLLYYPMFVAGDCEMTETLFRMYSHDLLDFHQKRTRRYLNHGGAYFPECMQPWGDHFIGCYGTENFKDRKDNLQHHPCHKYEWLGQLELSQMMIHRYLYTEDADWFKTKALPAIREYVRYFDEHYRLAADGRYDWQPAQACETWWKCVTPMTEVAGLTSITEQLLALPKDLVGADDRALFAKIRARIPALPTRKLKDGRLAYAPAAKFELHRNVEHPELYCVFPFRLCSFEKPNAEYGRNAYEVRSPQHYNGWSQEELFTAYLGMGEETKKNFLHRVTTNSDKYFRWPAFWGPNFDWKPDQCHGGNVQNILQSMILQYDGRKIFLFPAWTKDWNCEFKLHAPYRTTVQGRIENGKVVDLVVTPASRRADLQICGGCQVDAN